MRKGLYCYFGRFYDHRANVPGHPLYQLFFLHSLSKKFGIDKFDVFYYDSVDNVYDFGAEEYDVLADVRLKLKRELVDVDGIKFDDLGSDYDCVFLKHRFRNFSRLRDKSLDCYWFERLQKKYPNAYIIDTDAMLRKSQVKNVITLFNCDFYSYNAENVVKVVPVLKEDILYCIEKYFPSHKEFYLTFIGNEYFKAGIVEVFKALKDILPEIKIYVQGKWNKYSFIEEPISRIERGRGYNILSQSICSIQISKLEYLMYDFLSPRIFESYLLGTIIFGQNKFMPKFSSYETVLELSEKIRFLNEMGLNEYKKILIGEVNELYEKLNEH